MNGHASILISDYITHKHGPYTPFRIIKMVVIAHGRTLAALRRPLIHDRIEAWRLGPTIPVLYHELSIWGDRPVRELRYSGTVPGEDARMDAEREAFFAEIIPEDERALIDMVVAEYDGWSSDDLRRLCCEPGTPWDQHYDGEIATEIPDGTIRAYYLGQMVLAASRQLRTI